MKKIRTPLKVCRQFIVQGAFVMAPYIITYMLVGLIFRLLDSKAQSLGLRVSEWLPDWLLIGRIPGLSIVMLFIVLGIIGAVSSTSFGKKAFALADRILGKIPIVGFFLRSLRTVTTLVQGPEGAMRSKRVVGLFLMSDQVADFGFVIARTVEEDGVAMLRVLIPSKPNTTGGAVYVVPEDRTWDANMTASQLIQYCMTMGVVVPPGARLRKPSKTDPPAIPDTEKAV